MKNYLSPIEWFYLLLGLVSRNCQTWKLILIIYDSFPFNADEAIVALMGRHILKGKFPIFFYGQAYMGSLDAFLVAFSFLIFGEKINAIRYVQILLYCGVLLTTFWLSDINFQISFGCDCISVILACDPNGEYDLVHHCQSGGIWRSFADR